MAVNQIEPKVFFDPASGLLKIEGRSLLRDVQEFYEPIIQQVTSTTVPTFIVEFKLEHFDTGTTKCLYQLLKVLKEKQGMGAMILIRWFSESGDEDHIELGQDLESRSGMKFQFVSE